MRIMKTLAVAGACVAVGLGATTPAQAQAQAPETAGTPAVQQQEEQDVTGAWDTERASANWLDADVNYLTVCDAHVYTDSVDRHPSQIFGAATVECDPGYLPRWPMTVDLFRMVPGGTPELVASGEEIDCTYTPCSGSSPYYTIDPGHTQYCARVTIYDLGDRQYEWEGNCPYF